jgi:hypothetical protein
MSATDFSELLMLKSRDLRLPSETNVFYCTADSVDGNSGGPALNAKGEVIAISRSGGKTLLSEKRFSVLVRPLEFDP